MLTIFVITVSLNFDYYQGRQDSKTQVTKLQPHKMRTHYIPRLLKEIHTML